MPSCPDCGAEVSVRETTTGDRVPIEEREEMSGEGRYVETDEGMLGVPEDAMVRAYVDHRLWCPAIIGYA